MAGKKIIFFELNEVPFRVLDEYCRRHPESFLARRLPACRQIETRSDDTVLSPWITWPTVHRGVLDTRHTIHYFGQHLERIDREFPPIWKILAERGVRPGVFGSLHTYPLPERLDQYAFFVPDTFAPASECYPASLSVFQEFNLVMARRSARNVSTQVPLGAALKLAAAVPSLGLRPSTLLSITKQLASERIDSWRRIRRRTFQVVLAFDIFMKQLRKTKPGFATFYTNHAASAMHRYWAAAFPGDYEGSEYDPAWIARFSGEIDFAMSWFDAFFERMSGFVDAHPDYELWVTTSMGQAATRAVRLETQLYLTDLAPFMATLGFPAEQWERRPAMEPQVAVQVDERAADRFRSAVKDVLVDGAPIEVDERERGFFCISLGQPNLAGRVEEAVIAGRGVPFNQLGMEHVPIEDQTNSNAYHVPGGILLIYGAGMAARSAGRPVISTLDIAPAILRNYGITAPSYMAAGQIAA